MTTRDRRPPGVQAVAALLGAVAIMVGTRHAAAAPSASPAGATAGASASAGNDRNTPGAASESRERGNGKSNGADNGGVALPDLAKLRAEYDRIREELFKARVRGQKAAEVAYPSKLDARLRWKGRPDFIIRKARFLLDGAELWDSADSAQTDDLIEIAERAVKPGPHALTVRLEIRPKVESKGGTKAGGEQLGHTSEHTVAIVVAETGKTHLFLTGDEDGDPPEYEPELELEIETDK